MAPVISSISPVQGPAAGGTAVTITGTGFTGATGVSFGSVSAPFTVVTSTKITATAPAGSGSVTVTVTAPGATSNGATYSYVTAPVITSISPAQGPTAGGTAVTIIGTGFTGATGVVFGSVSAAFTVVSSTQITATAPAGSGAVSVTVTTSGGTSNGATYSYVAAPVVSTLSPTQGPSTGGNTVTITGTGLTGATAVMFGSTPTAFTVVSATQITATAPGAPVAPVAVTVVTAGGTSNGVLYYYLPLPTVAAVSPSMGPVAGGNTVTITGTGLALTTAVHFGSGAATGVTVVSDNQITVHAPSGTGTVAVTASTPGGTSLAGLGIPYYTYVALPAISALTPAQGPANGGTAVTITGSNLGLTQSVLFGGIAAPFVAVSDTEVVATNPGGAAGSVAVTVITPGGVSNTATYQLLVGPSV
jgi:hypothetical protein